MRRLSFLFCYFTVFTAFPANSQGSVPPTGVSSPWATHFRPILGLFIFLTGIAAVFMPWILFASVIVPNSSTLSWIIDGDVKVFHLVAEPVKRELAPGLVINAWGYNGSTPGPLIEAVEGDRVRILVTNHLPEPTSIHWHGILLPNDMDGVSGLTQKAIQPSETFKYEFTLKQNGTYMYHPHTDDMVQIGMGMVGIFVIHPKEAEDLPVDRDYAIMLSEWAIPVGGNTPDPLVMLDFNFFTFNGVAYPLCEPLMVKSGERIRIRFANLSMDNHPIHVHGHTFTVTRRGAQRLPISAQYQEVTVDVPVGTTRDIEFVADALGDWPIHCHKTHHTMNGMVHDLPNVIGIEWNGLEERIRKFLPNFMAMGQDGMEEMFTHHHMKTWIPMGAKGPYGVIDMGGMFTIMKVSDD